MTARPSPTTLVVGLGPLARAIAAGLARHGPVVLGSPDPIGGGWFWRRLEPSTGEGVKAAAAGMARVVVAVDDATQELHGAFLGLRKVHVGQAVVVHPIDAEAPAGANEVPAWGRLAVGGWWGPHEPLWAAWRERALAGKPIVAPDAGELGLLSEHDVCGVILALFDQSHARWRAAGPPCSFTDLAHHAQAGTNVAIKTGSITAAARKAGLPAAYLQRLLEHPVDVRETDPYDDTWRGGPARVRTPLSAPRR